MSHQSLKDRLQNLRVETSNVIIEKGAHISATNREGSPKIATGISNKDFKSIFNKNKNLRDSSVQPLRGRENL